MATTDTSHNPVQGSYEAEITGKSLTRTPEISMLSTSVATASAIVVQEGDPYKILVAHSAKHSKLVIPGGKMEAKDMEAACGDLKSAAVVCVVREVGEEIRVNLKPSDLKYVGMVSDPARDVREVPASKLDGCFCVPQLPSDISPEATVKASYGTPDSLFVVTVKPSQVQDSDELSGAKWIDIRAVKPGDLGAGHDIIVMHYLKTLQPGADAEFSIENTRAAADKLFGEYDELRKDLGRIEELKQAGTYDQTIVHMPYAQTAAFFPIFQPDLSALEGALKQGGNQIVMVDRQWLGRAVYFEDAETNNLIKYVASDNAVGALVDLNTLIITGKSEVTHKPGAYLHDHSDWQRDRIDSFMLGAGMDMPIHVAYLDGKFQATLSRPRFGEGRVAKVQGAGLSIWESLENALKEWDKR